MSGPGVAVIITGAQDSLMDESHDLSPSPRNPFGLSNVINGSMAGKINEVPSSTESPPTVSDTNVNRLMVSPNQLGGLGVSSLDTSNLNREGSCDKAQIDEEFDMDSLGLDVFDDEFDALLEGDPDSESFGIDGRGDPTCNSKGDTTNEADSSHTAEGQAQVVSTPRHADRSTSCVYKGLICRCIADDHLYDSSLPSISVAHVDETCVILCSLKLKFHTRHRYLICTCMGGSFLAFHDLKSHLKLKHKKDLRDEDTQTMERDFKYVVSHISASFGITTAQKPRDFNKEEFDGPIAGICPPLECHLCPFPGCKSFCTNMDSVTSHYKSSHRLSGMTFKAAHVNIRWTQYPFISRGSHSARVEVDNSRGPPPAVPCPQMGHSNSSIRRYVAPQGVAAPGSPWLHHVGWTIWRDGHLEQNHTISSLCDMVTLPKQISKYQSQATDEKVLYLISSWIQSRAVKMLKDGIAWLAGSELQSAITAKYTSFPIMPSQFLNAPVVHTHAIARSVGLLHRPMPAVFKNYACL